MPVNKEGVEVNYTSNQDVQYLLEAAEDGTDFAVEFTGYLAEVFGHSKVKKSGDDSETDLYKAVITNGTKRISLLIWGLESIEKHSKEMLSGKILHLDGCHGQMSKSQSQQKYKANNMLNYEILIQPGSLVETKGTHVFAVKINAAIPLIGFIDIAKTSGEFQVQTYIKTVFAEAHNMDGPTGFGSGSITEGVHKVPVKIKSFQANDCANLTKGSCVLLRGTVQRSGKLTVICKNISYIQLLENEEKMPMEVVSNANEPLKRWEPHDDKQSPAPKKPNFQSSKENLEGNLMVVDGKEKSE